MSKIEFIASEMAGYYAEFMQGPEFDMFEGKDKDFYSCIKALEKEIQKDNIKNIDEFKDFVFGNLPEGYVGQEKKSEICSKMDETFDKHHNFYSSNEDIIQRHVETMDKLQDDPEVGYIKELESLYNFFGIDKNMPVKGLMAPVSNKTNDGKAGLESFVHYFSLEKTEPESEYVDGTTVLRKKVSTPLHETTHVLFANSEAIKKLAAKDGDGAKRLMETLEKHFMENPQDKLNGIKDEGVNAKFAINEALAASSTALVMTKYGEKPGSAEWYTGFEGANKLAAQTYSIYMDYLHGGKAIDDSFFMKIAKKFEATEKSNMLKNNLHKNEKEDTFKPTNIGNRDISKNLPEIIRIQKLTSNQKK